MLPGGSFKSLEMIFMMHVDEFDHSDITTEVLKKKYTGYERPKLFISWSSPFTFCLKGMKGQLKQVTIHK